MAKRIDDIRRQLQRVKQELNEKLPDFALINTITAKALIERNIREFGFGAHYSGNKLPTWFFDGRAKSKAGEAFIKAQEKRDAAAKEGDDTGMTWADLRRAEGLPVDHVDLGFTNKMWAGLGPQRPYYEGGRLHCPLGGSTKEVVDKLNWNRDRYGDFLGKVLTKKEIDILREVLTDEIAKVFENNGFKRK